VWLSDQSQTPMNADNVCDVGMNDNVNIDVMNNDITNVTSLVMTDKNDDDVDDDNGDIDDDDAVLNLDDVDCDKSQNVANAEQLALEQQNDKSLALCFSLAKHDKAGYFIRDGILYRREKILGHEVEQLCLPKTRRPQAIRLAHHGYGGHLSARNTKARLKLSFTWPTIAVDVQGVCEKCEVCQRRRRVTVYDRVPIAPVPNNEVVFDTFVMDCLGPIFPNQKVKFNYCSVLIDRVSRFPMEYALTSLSAKNVCNALMQMFQITGIPSVIQSDCGTNFTSQLTRTFLNILGCSPKFNVPGRPQQMVYAKD